VVDLNDVLRWVVSRGLALLIGAAVLLVIYRLARPAIHRVVPAFMHAQAQHLPAGSVPADELGKRSATIEDLLDKLLRVFVIAGLVALVLAVFDLWSILAGLVLIIAAVMVSSQEVVLDYVMGFLILVEGPYFKGDWISVLGQAGGIEGTVQEVGLRRTVLRDMSGSLNAVSNGLIRASSNVTRVYSVAVVEVQVLRAQDVERAIVCAARVAREMQEDAAWSDRFAPDTPSDIWVTAMTIDGTSLRLQQRVATGMRMPVSSELRRRLIAAFVAESIGTARWDTPLPIVSEPPG
jgi:small-conductance mechanosensitive channel